MDLENLIKKSLYIIIPVIFIIIAHLIVSFVMLECNPFSWNIYGRIVAVFLYIIAVMIGIGIFTTIND